MPGEPAAAEAGVMLQQPGARCVLSLGICPWITGPWQWWAAQALGRGGVASDLCLHTGSWWLQQEHYHFMPVSGVRADNRSLHPSLKLL